MNLRTYCTSHVQYVEMDRQSTYYHWSYPSNFTSEEKPCDSALIFPLLIILIPSSGAEWQRWEEDRWSIRNCELLLSRAVWLLAVDKAELWQPYSTPSSIINREGENSHSEKYSFSKVPPKTGGHYTGQNIIAAKKVCQHITTSRSPVTRRRLSLALPWFYTLVCRITHCMKHCEMSCVWEGKCEQGRREEREWIISTGKRDGSPIIFDVDVFFWMYGTIVILWI